MRMRTKLGLVTSLDADALLIQDLLELMQEEQTDYTLTFRLLGDLVEPAIQAEQGVHKLIELPASFSGWVDRWKSRIADESQSTIDIQSLMYRHNPVFIPRNHLVEEVIAAATNEMNFEPFEKLVDVLNKPFSYQQSLSHFAQPPHEDQVVHQTFCGT